MGEEWLERTVGRVQEGIDPEVMVCTGSYPPFQLPPCPCLLEFTIVSYKIASAGPWRSILDWEAYREVRWKI